MDNNKHIVLRKDVSSNKMYPKLELIRVVKNKDGEIFIDKTRKANGRGVYLRPTIEAVNKVQKNKALERGLKTKVADEIYQLLIEEIEKNWD
ncbi:putative RNA-binding protein [Spiroplasma helicoides]|uniref:Putative RNA-binding protein n=1 Tax=Spiroplasma helicoides TaxID=216938 RepID=A0A1B3SK39_9MOLU|nr:YlxR family protein [Spiroplasma helicoides]AOG60288.1 putative RNA-binding protein [Spiroplasma helicoides]